MLDLFNIAKPQGCDIQTFYGSSGTGLTARRSWLKPRGVSHVYMMLIGAGGGGDGTTGGGSGAVTVWYGAAQHVPDSLNVVSASDAGVTAIVAQILSTPVTLLSASPGTTVGGAAMSANQFTASGFFQSIAGQSGVTTGVSASTTTFLSAGTAGQSSDVTANYGYDTTATNGNGYFQMQPILVGVGAPGSGKGGIGCGGGGSGLGGQSLVLIASW